MTAKKIPAKKAATKTGGKPAEALKPSAPKAKAVRSDRPIDSDRATINGITRPHAQSIAGKLWAIADNLRESLKRNPARFEYRAKVAAENEKIVAKGGEAFVDNSISFQFFKWRTFNGIKGREAGLYPKRNSFDLSVPVVRTPRKPKETPAPVAKPAKETVKGKGGAHLPKLPPVALPAASKPAAKVPAKKATKAAKKAAGVKPAAKKTAPVKVDAPAPASVPAAPAVSSRLANISEAAAHSA